MISSSSRVRDNVHEEIDTLSVYNCIFCNKPLNGKAKLLECLHIVCYECIEKKIDDSGLKCKCLAVTGVPINFIVDYPIVSSSVTNAKQCEFCNLKANKYCAFCKKFYCEFCSQIHLNIIVDRIHSTDLVVPYPMTNQFVLCSGCSEKNAEVYCTQCSMMICHFCHLSFHCNHNFKVLNELHDEIKMNLSEELYDLKENDDCLKNVLDSISKVTQKLETQKKSVLDEIDIAALKLHQEINKRSFKLKELVENNFKHSVDSINNNEKILKDSHEKFNYDMKLVKTVKEHNNVDDLMKLSKTVLKKLEQNKVIFASSLALKLEVNMKFNGDESIDKCISVIKNVGNVTLTPVSLSEMLGDNKGTPNSNSDGFMNLPLTILNDNCNEKERILTSSNNSSSDSDSSEYEPMVDCSCCNQWDEVSKFIQCKFCNRYFHHECHIPTVSKDMNVCESSQTKWGCTLCKDLDKYVKILNQMDISGNIPVGTVELIIMERILMELYCQNYDSEHYRELPDIKIYPFYYQQVSHPLSLNDVKKTLESNPSYTSLIRFFLDLKKIFFNGLSYYSACDPYYRSAVNLLNSLQRLINRWIPKLSNDTRLY